MKITIDISKRQRLIKAYWMSTRKVLALTRSIVSNHAEHTDPERLKDQVLSLMTDNDNMKHINSHIVGIWEKVGGKFAYDTSRQILKAKGLDNELELKAAQDKLTDYQKRMRAYAAERSLQKTKSILTSQAEGINKVIDDVIKESLDGGYGILKTRKLLKDSLSGEVMTTIENWQAQRIAQTEVIAAANTGSFESAKDMGVEGVQKEWSFQPGLKTFRENHKEWDGQPQDMDYEYAPGLKFPGDPDCDDPAEVINCYCSITWNLDNVA